MPELWELSRQCPGAYWGLKSMRKFCQALRKTSPLKISGNFPAFSTCLSWRASANLGGFPTTCPGERQLLSVRSQRNSGQMHNCGAYYDSKAHTDFQAHSVPVAPLSSSHQPPALGPHFPSPSFSFLYNPATSAIFFAWLFLLVLSLLVPSLAPSPSHLYLLFLFHFLLFSFFSWFSVVAMCRNHKASHLCPITDKHTS